MDKSSKNKHAFTIKLLAFVVIACAWLIPASPALSAHTSGDVKVSLSVTNSVGVDFGRSAMDVVPEGKLLSGFTKLISKKIIFPVQGGLFASGLRFPKSEVLITVINL